MSGGTQPDSTNYPSYLQSWHHKQMLGVSAASGAGAAIASAVYPSMSVGETMNAAFSNVAGTPYDNAIPANPLPLIGDIEGARDNIEDVYLDMDPDSDIMGWFAKAKTIYETSVADNAALTAALNASTAARDSQLQRRIGQVMTEYSFIGAYMNTQLAEALRGVLRDDSLDRKDLEMRLVLSQERDRSMQMNQIVGQFVGMRQSQLQAAQTYFAATFDSAKFSIAARDDAMSQALAWEESRRLWDLRVQTEGNQVMSGIFGAVTMPRNPTKGERLASSISIALSTGFQAGTMFGSPQAGIALGLATLGFNALPALLDG